MEHQAGPGATGPGSQGWAEGSTAPVAQPSGSDIGAARDDAPLAAGAADGASAASRIPAEPVPITGEPRVDAALRLLERLPGMPVSDHPELFERVHAELSDVLGELGSEPAGPADNPRG